MVAGQASVHSRESVRCRVHIVADQEAWGASSGTRRGLSFRLCLQTMPPTPELTTACQYSKMRKRGGVGSHSNQNRKVARILSLSDLKSPDNLSKETLSWKIKSLA